MLNQHIEPNISVWSGQNQIWRDRPVSEESQSVLPVGQAWPLLSSHRVVPRERLRSAGLKGRKGECWQILKI